jgi:hypothetical protein
MPDKTQTKPVNSLIAKILLVTTLLFIFCAAQAAPPPDTVINAFHQQYPFVKKTKWKDVGEKRKTFQVEFLNGNTLMHGYYDEQGTLLETDKPCKTSEVPDAVISYLEKQFDTFKIKSSLAIERNHVVCCYELHIKADGSSTTIVITTDGFLTSR